MASLVLGAVGGYFFGPVGWMIGSAVGSLLFPTKQEGPKLNDLKLQGSSYGAMIPITYGTVRLAGQVVWQTDLKQHKHKSGGKGGPQVTTYSYTASFAVKICKGPMGGLLRMWADSTLIYDTTPTGTTDNSKVPVTIYLGVESALADPTMEADLGVGNVPAFRDDMVCVFTDMDLTNYGNRLPSLSFEVFGASGSIPWRVSNFTYPQDTGNYNQSSATIEGGYVLIGSVDLGVFTLNQYKTDGTFVATTLSIVPDPPDPASSSQVLHTYVNNWPHVITLQRPRTYGTGEPDQSAFYYDGANTLEPLGTGGLGAQTYLNGVSVDCVYSSVSNAFYSCGTVEFGPSPVFQKWDASMGEALSGPTAQYIPISAGTGGRTGQSYTVAASDDGTVWFAEIYGQNTDIIYHLDADLNLINSWTQRTVFSGQQQIGRSFVVWNGLLCFCSNTNILGLADVGAYLYRTDGVFTFVGSTPVVSNVVGRQMSDLGNGLVLLNDGIISLNPPAVPAILGDIVKDISERAGLVSGQLDVSDLPDQVPGYLLTQQADARADIIPLQSMWFFDAVERAGQMVFVKRGKPSAITIPDNDLAAQSPGATPPPLVTYKRVQEVDLPAVVNVTYINENAFYQTGTQEARRQVTLSQAVANLQLPIVVSDALGRRSANVNCFGTWLERDVFTILLPRKYEYLEPTDVISTRGYTMRVIRKSDVATGVIQLEGVQTNQELYLAAPAGNPTNGAQQTQPGATVPTELLLLDIPLIDDADNATNPNGAYAAMAGTTANAWPGATLYKSSDGGATFASILVDNTADTIGASTTILGGFGGGNAFDETNTVTVLLHAGAGPLASSNTLGVLNGANLALLGDEGFQFRDATLTAPLTYELGGLLRGRRGTEWAITGHIAGERFVLLPASAQVNNPFSELQQVRDYKGVTNGSNITTALDIPFTNNGVALRCYSPTGIGGGLNASGDLAIFWQRRTRVGGAWANLVDVPLSEATESYIVQIWDSTFSNCARIIGPVSSPAATYTSAQQVTDFGAQQKTIFVTVGQLGTLGLGIQSGAALLGAGASVDPVIAPIPPYGSGPPVPPPSGGCTGTVFTDTLTWAVGDSGIISAPGGFLPGTNWVLSLTTPGSGNFLGVLYFFEYGGPPGMKHGRLSTTNCGAALIPAVDQNQFYPQFRFAVGANPYPTQYASLGYGTLYKFSLQTDVSGQTAVEMQIANN